jgi:hypothetical protein
VEFKPGRAHQEQSDCRDRLERMVLGIRPYYSNVKAIRRLFQIFCQAFLIDACKGLAWSKFLG